jgi:hypothetical protein
MATLVHFGARELICGVFEKRFQHLHRLERHPHFTFLLTHSSKST